MVFGGMRMGVGERDLRRLEFGEQHEEIMFLEPKVAPHRGLPRVLRLEILDLDDQSFTLLLVLTLQSDDLSVIPAPVVSTVVIALPHEERTP